MISVLRRRLPLVEVDILPVPVQGDAAPAQIARCSKPPAAPRRHDVLMWPAAAARCEDLWAFNDEALARAIAACPVPVVSAVGHEVDFTIADFVADLRAPTPSAAAELLVPDGAELARELARRAQRARAAIERQLRGLAQRTDLAHARLAALQPARRLALLAARLDGLRARLAAAPRARLALRVQQLALARARLQGAHPHAALALRRQTLASLRQRLQAVAADTTNAPQRRLALVVRALHAVSPLATLSRGYAIVRLEGGRVLHQPADAPADTPLHIQLDGGLLRARSLGPEAPG